MKKSIRSSANIMIMGVGGGGTTIVETMFTKGVVSRSQVMCIVAKRYRKKMSPVDCIVIGDRLSRSMVECSDINIGREAALDEINVIKNYLINKRINVLLLVSTLGGTTGCGATPAIVEAAKMLGIYTASIITTPFDCEGQQRKQHASIGVTEIGTLTDYTFVIDNNLLASPRLNLYQIFKDIDLFISEIVCCIHNSILLSQTQGVKSIDLNTILLNKGLCFSEEEVCPDGGIVATLHGNQLLRDSSS